jgi:hypothetical protein
LSIRATCDSVKRREGAVFIRFKPVRRFRKVSILAVWTAVNASLASSRSFATATSLARFLRKDPDSGIGTNKRRNSKTKTDKQLSHSCF